MYQVISLADTDAVIGVDYVTVGFLPLQLRA